MSNVNFCFLDYFFYSFFYLINKCKKTRWGIYMWHVTSDTWHVTRDTWHMTHDTWHVTCDMLWGVNILSKFQLGNFGSTITITIWWSCLVDNCYQPDRQRDGSRSNPWAGRGQAQGSGDWGMGELKVHLYSLTNDTLWKTLMHSLH